MTALELTYLLFAVGRIEKDRTRYLRVRQHVRTARKLLDGVPTDPRREDSLELAARNDHVALCELNNWDYAARKRRKFRSVARSNPEESAIYLYTHSLMDACNSASYYENDTVLLTILREAVNNTDLLGKWRTQIVGDLRCFYSSVQRLVLSGNSDQAVAILSSVAELVADGKFDKGTFETFHELVYVCATGLFNKEPRKLFDLSRIVESLFRKRFRTRDGVIPLFNALSMIVYLSAVHGTDFTIEGIHYQRLIFEGRQKTELLKEMDLSTYERKIDAINIMIGSGVAGGDFDGLDRWHILVSFDADQLSPEQRETVDALGELQEEVRVRLGNLEDEIGLAALTARQSPSKKNRNTAGE